MKSHDIAVRPINQWSNILYVRSHHSCFKSVCYPSWDLQYYNANHECLLFLQTNNLTVIFFAELFLTFKPNEGRSIYINSTRHAGRITRWFVEMIGST